MPKLARLSLDVSPKARRLIRVAAAGKDQTIRDYVWGAVAARLKRDLGRGVMALHAASDPVLAELWDNPSDAGYDRL
ncbi:MAG: hypothetical protein ACRDOE_23535 [Streptosporangiaceae bacterium]